jgi:hypothetical protein
MTIRLKISATYATHARRIKIPLLGLLAEPCKGGQTIGSGNARSNGNDRLNGLRAASLS